MTAQFAIVGSGPGGMYAADALLKQLPDCRIDVYERFPAPFGLIRYGVAPDHFKTRNTARQFIRTLELDNVTYFGNVEVGRDVTLEELERHYDAVIIAVGAYNDRTLGIPGEELPGVYGACAFVGWYNGHPDHRHLDPLLDGEGVAVIGIGNVALDVCRVLAKTPAEMSGSDLCAHAAEAIQAGAYKNLYMFGRRGPLEAGFTPKELGEIKDLERCQVIVDQAQLPGDVPDDFDGRVKGIKEKNLQILHELALQNKPDLPIKMNVRFYSAPKEIIGTDRVEAIRVERTKVEDGFAVGTGEIEEIPVGAVVTAIGYRTEVPGDLALDRGRVANQGGRVRPGIYVVGWAKRGPSGTIPTNGPDSRDVAEAVIADLQPSDKPGGKGIWPLLGERNSRVVTWDEWERIAEQEIARAPAGRPRERFTSVDEMLSVLDNVPRKASNQ